MPGRSTTGSRRNARASSASSSFDAAEIAVDLAILDPLSQLCVLRGDIVESGKYRGRRVLGSGINLTHLYRGKVPFIWYLQRDLGIVNKIYRGLARPDAAPDDVTGNTREKPWIAVVEGFAIGGHCQYQIGRASCRERVER